MLPKGCVEKVEPGPTPKSVVMRLYGSIDHASLPNELEAAVDRCSGEGIRYFLFDMQNVKSFGDMGVGTFVAIVDNVYKDGGATVLIANPKTAMAIIDWMKLGDFFKIVPDQQQAEDYIRSRVKLHP